MWPESERLSHIFAVTPFNTQSLIVQRYLVATFLHLKKDDLLLPPQTTPIKLSISRQYVTVALKCYTRVSV